MTDHEGRTTILVTGATGYIGSQLVPRLLQAGYAVRVLIREDAARMARYAWRDQVEIVVGDVLLPDSLAAALRGVNTAYFLIHSMADHLDFSQKEIEAAANFAAAAAAEGVNHIIYLGGLGQEEESLSAHLQSRQQTGHILRRGPVPVTEFRAGMIVGSGSLSFELLRSLTEQLPLIVAPPWIDSKSQPVAIDDVLDYLTQALEHPQSRGQIIEIGGADIVTYAEMIKTYARLRKLRRVIVRSRRAPIDFFAVWVRWLTPVSANTASPLLAGMRHQLVVRDPLAKQLFPDIQPMDFETSVCLALERIEKGDFETWWQGTRFASQGEIRPIYLGQEQGLIVERRVMTIDASAAAVFDAFYSLGSLRRWPQIDRIWRRGRPIANLAGTAGRLLERGLPKSLRPSEAIEIWHIEEIVPQHALRLRFKMIMLGQGWLVFEAQQRDDGRTDLVQTAYFATKGLPGLAYWYGLYPAHGLILSRMIRDIAQRATQTSAKL